MNVPFLDLKRLAQATADETRDAVQAVTASGRVILGPEVRGVRAGLGARRAASRTRSASARAPTRWSSRCARSASVPATRSSPRPTPARRPPRRSRGPARASCSATSTRRPGASTSDRSKAALTERTRAVVPVHLYGQCADVDAVRACFPTGCGCSRTAPRPTGAPSRAGRRAPSATPRRGRSTRARTSARSGTPARSTTNDPVLADRMRELRQYGAFGQSDAAASGSNSRLDELQAAVLRPAPRAPPGVDGAPPRDRRGATATRSRAPALEPLELDPRGRARLPPVRRPQHRAGRVPAPALERGVQTLVHYPTPLHRLPAFAASVATPVSLARSELLCDQVLSLPLNPLLSDAEVGCRRRREPVGRCLTSRSPWWPRPRLLR